jgi:hypothetical protein
MRRWHRADRRTPGAPDGAYRPGVLLVFCTMSRAAQFVATMTYQENTLSKRLLFLLPILFIGSLLLAACGASGLQSNRVKLVPVSELPQQMRDAPVAVRTAYQFAVASPDALENVPCYCGCGAIGHESNLACYIKGFDSNGRPAYDDHALGCSICVDIATDVMKMTGEGKSAAEIRQQIVDSYSKFGPANQ